MCHDEKRNPKCESRPGAKRPTIVTSVISTRCLGENLVKLETVAVRSGGAVPLDWTGLVAR